MPEQARLRIHSYGDIEVDLVVAYLNDVRHAYNSILVFKSSLDRLVRASREMPFPYWFGGGLGWPLLSSRGFRVPREWPLEPVQVASFIPRTEQLVLAAVTLTSPGFWEFLGSLNPLEVLRKYLNDRHERRKDREYRETAERRRLEIENFERETHAIAERVRLGKEIGATDTDLAPLLNEFVHKPLRALDRYQDRAVIEHAEIVRLPERR